MWIHGGGWFQGGKWLMITVTAGMWGRHNEFMGKEPSSSSSTAGTSSGWATRAGHSEDVCVKMWQRIIEIYDRYMPRGIGLSPALSPVLRGDRCTARLCAWAKEKYPGRVWFQRNILKERTVRNPTDAFSRQFREAAAFTTVGWQMAYLPCKDIVGDRSMAYRHAVATRASFVEVYPVDFNNSDLRSALIALNEGLKRNQLRLTAVSQ